MNTFEKFIGHLSTITAHHNLVMRLCFKAGIPYQGIIHDLSKYSPVEFVRGVMYYQGDRSPINAEIKKKGYSTAQFHHNGHNPHHWQYWVTVINGQYVAYDMPLNYIKEMACDRIAACMIYQKDKYTSESPLRFLDNGHETPLIPRKTYLKLRQYLIWVRDYPLDSALEMIRKDK